MVRNRRLVRVLSIINNLSTGARLSLAALSQLYGVHPRTIRRDIEAIEEAHAAPIQKDGELYWIARS